MIKPALETHDLYQGATWERLYEIEDGYGNPVDLTGCTAKLIARDTPDDVTKLLDIDGVVDQPGGTVYFKIPPTATVGQTWAKAGFDAELYWVDTTKVDKLALGTFKLVREFTR